MICRWNYKGITVDIMPTDPSILGFSNKWYAEGIKTAIEISLSYNLKIKIFSSPYFIASKLEAFQDRGKGEMRWSADFEDIVYILDNRKEIVEELSNIKGKVKEYINEQFINLLANKNLNEGLACALSYDAGSAGVEKIKRIMGEIIK